MNCPYCGAEANKGNKFCTSCGKPIPEETEQVLLCIGCGAKLSPEDRFCTVCGRETSEVYMEVEDEDDDPGYEQGSGKKKFFTKTTIIVGASILFTLAVIAAISIIFIPKIRKNRDSDSDTTQKAIEETEKKTEKETEGETKSSYADPVSMSALESVTATSILKEGTFIYYVDYIKDKDLTTAWTEGASDDGIGEGITFVFDTEQLITGLAINNGFQKSTDLYNKNSRVKQLKIIDGDGNEQYVDVKDTQELQLIDFNKDIVSDTISVYIAQVYIGSAYNDTCISEMSFYGSYEDRREIEKNGLAPKPKNIQEDLSFPRNMYVKVDELLVRTGPGTQYQAIWKLYTGEMIWTYGISNGWAHISWNGQDAYVSADYISDKRP